MTTAPTIELNNGVAMPLIGLGTYPLDDRQVAETVVAATGIGYRLIDTAAKYGNESGVGDGIRACGVPREELFVTTKLDGGYQGGDRAIPGLDASLGRLRLDYVDLLLIHWPLPRRGRYVDTWTTFEKILASGKARAIGVSNFVPAHLEVLGTWSGVVPDVNQIELNPAVARVGVRGYDDDHGIVTQAWSPLGRGDLVTDPTVTAIADRLGRAAGQVILRWHVQHGLSAVPKSANPDGCCSTWGLPHGTFLLCNVSDASGNGTIFTGTAQCGHHGKPAGLRPASDRPLECISKRLATNRTAFPARR